MFWRYGIKCPGSNSSLSTNDIITLSNCWFDLFILILRKRKIQSKRFSVHFVRSISTNRRNSEMKNGSLINFLSCAQKRWDYLSYNISLNICERQSEHLYATTEKSIRSCLWFLYSTIFSVSMYKIYIILTCMHIMRLRWDVSYGRALI